MACCDDPVEISCTRETAFKDRLAEVLECAAGIFPSLFVTVDLWRPFSKRAGDDYPDERVEAWMRLAENVDAFNFEKQDKFYQANVGLIRQKVNQMLLTDIYDLQPDDHIILQGQSFVVIDTTSQAGVQKLTIDAPKSRFKVPSRSSPTYRGITMRARIL